jgi:hypothetical protein
LEKESKDSGTSKESESKADKGTKKKEEGGNNETAKKSGSDSEAK